MHRVWNVPELLALIFQCFDDKSDLLRCALVCRAFSAEAARLIWKKVDDFGNLLGCFPQDTISVELSGPSNDPNRTFRFLHLPHPSEWDRMRYRARMIKELTFSEFDDYDNVLEVIQRCKIDLAFPELISLHFYISVVKRFQTFLPLFAASRLQALEINFEGYNDPLVDTSMVTLVAQAHPLRSLDIGATGFPELSQHSLIQIIETTPSLDFLRLGLATYDGEEIVEAAARLPNLRDLQIAFADGDGERTDYPPGFQSLVRSKIWAPYTSALAITRAITSSRITSLHLTVNDETMEQPTLLLDAIVTMTSLNTLTLIFFRSDIPQWQDMEVLLSLPLIVDFDISVAGPGMELDDEVISAISRTWPNLIRLRLSGPRSKPEEFTRPSLRGLAVLLAGCPKLRELHLEIDAREQQLRAALAQTHPPSSNLREKLTFNVQTSPITEGSEDAVADYLWALWSGEWNLRCIWWGGDTSQRDAWEKVDDLLQGEEEEDYM